MQTRLKNFLRLNMCLLGLILYLPGQAADQKIPDTPPAKPAAKKKPVHVFSVEKAVASAVRQGHADQFAHHAEEIVSNRNRLEELGIAQHRVSQSLQKMQGMKVSPQLLDSSLYETGILIKLLDDVLAEINARQQADKKGYEKLVSQHVNQQIIQTTIPLYWQAVGVKQVSAKTSQLIKAVQDHLKSVIHANTQASDKEIPNEQQKNQLLQLLSELKHIQAENDAILVNLATAMGTSKDNINKRVFLPVKKLPVPYLNVPTEQINTLSLAKQPLPARLKQKQVAIYLQSTNPGLNINWSGSRNDTLNPWLSAGKNLAFDLYNNLDKMERKQLLKQEQQQREDVSKLLAAASMTRARLAYAQYQQSRESFSLAICLQTNAINLQALNTDWLDQSLQNDIRKIEHEKTRIDLTLRLYHAYARLQADFYRLGNSISSQALPEKLETRSLPAISKTIAQTLKQSRHNKNTDSFSCYTSAAEKLAQAQTIQQLVEEKAALKKQIADLKKKPKPKPKPKVVQKAKPQNKLANDWLKKQNPRAYTLQILSHADSKRLHDYISKHRLGSQARVIKTRYKNKTLYGLLYGLYKDKELAFIDQFKLPEAVQTQNQIMIRRIADVQKHAK